MERAIRDELNQCSALFRAICESKPDGSPIVAHQTLGRGWAFFWCLVSAAINIYVAMVMMVYVVVSIATFDMVQGDLMDFILGIVGSLGMIGFDDGIIDCLPMWGDWYQMHTYWHPQGAHPGGCFIDDALGDTPEGQVPAAGVDDGEFPPPGYVIRDFSMVGRSSLGFQVCGNGVTGVNGKNTSSMCGNAQSQPFPGSKYPNPNMLRGGERIFAVRRCKQGAPPGVAVDSRGFPADPSKGWQSFSDDGGLKAALRALKGQPGTEWLYPEFQFLVNLPPRNPKDMTVKSGRQGCTTYDGEEKEQGKEMKCTVIVPEMKNGEYVTSTEHSKMLMYYGKPHWILLASIFDQMLHDAMYVLTRALIFGSLLYILTAYYIEPKSGRHLGI